ncbi:30S ribosomal protein S4, partial [Candidatus Sumerlaeota bacterium]|nr:30S ribosomal protein S4 [Candidatus Sumerlaeota bacterium]
KKVDIPSYTVSVGQAISLEEKLKQSKSVLTALERIDKNGRVAWLEYNPETFTSRLLTIPAREDIPVDIQEQVIVELYSK